MEKLSPVSSSMVCWAGGGQRGTKCQEISPEGQDFKRRSSASWSLEAPQPKQS